MDKKKYDGFKIARCILSFFMICAFAFFLICEVVLPSDNSPDKGEFKVFKADWVRVFEDGSTEPVVVPGTCKAKAGEWVSIITMLPEDLGDTSLCIRSLQQDFRIYVGGELRKEYTTVDTQLFGKTSTISYVIFDIEDEDAGKELRIDSMTISSYTGYVSELYMGKETQIWKYFLRMYGAGTVIAVFLFIMALVVVIGSLIVKFTYKTEFELLHLGSAILVSSTWLLAESKLRQFILPNSTVAVYMGFFMIMLLPYPCLAYLNQVQKKRYRKVYYAVAVAEIINCVVTVVLQVLGIKDFYEIMISSHIIIVAMLITITTTTVIDIRNGHIAEYKEVAIGFMGLVVFGAIELLLVYVGDTPYNGIPLCLGLVFLFVSAGSKTVRDIFKGEKEKQSALAASESKARFLANMSHEIRTPINTVIGMNEMIMRENENPDIAEYSLNIKNASHMLLGLINDVLDFSKIEAGKLQIVESEYQLASMLNDVIVSARIRAEKKDLSVFVDIDETMPITLKGDEIRIKQILNNLLSNAVKYTEKGSITFAAKGIKKQDSFTIQMSVTDTGKGIRKEDLKKLFGTFQRLDLKENRYIEGTGLGLNISKHLVESMKGTIDVESTYGVGSCFTVRIPQQVVNAEPMGNLDERYKELIEHQKTQAQRATEDKGHFYAPDANILVVDDNKMNLLVIKGLLKRSAVSLDMAAGGNECLAMTKDKKYDLILMDHMMPEPDGIQTLHMLREDVGNINHDTKVVVLTANAIDGVEQGYIKEGFVGYLSKPVDVEKLEAMLKEHINK